MIKQPEVNYVLAIDPGPVKSGWLVYDYKNRCPLWVGDVPMFGHDPNEEVLDVVHDRANMWDRLAIEMVRFYGKDSSVGDSIFRSCVWIGEFKRAWLDAIYAGSRDNTSVTEIYRQDQFRHLLTRPTGTGAMLRQALIDKYPATGGGKIPQIGIKAAKGLLYGITSHVWSALAIAETFMSMEDLRARETANDG